MVFQSAQRGYHGNLKARIGYKRATLATAQELLRRIYAILRDDHPYRDPKVTYESLLVKCNPPRWLRMLSKYNYLEEVRAAAQAEPGRLQTTAQDLPPTVVGPEAADRGCLGTVPAGGPSVTSLPKAKRTTETGELRSVIRVFHGKVTSPSSKYWVPRVLYIRAVCPNPQMYCKLLILPNHSAMQADMVPRVCSSAQLNVDR